MELAPELAAVTEVCYRAGELLSGYFNRGDAEVHSKAKRQDIVTQADVEAEGLILMRLREDWPDDGFLAEESGRSEGRSGRIWCVDPLDGTANFAAGYPHWAVAVSLLEDGVPVLAVTHDPLRGETFAAAGEQSRSTPAGSLRTVHRIEDALIADNRPFAQRETVHPLELTLRRSRGRRESGSMALDFAWLSIGRLDAVFYERSERLWDYIGGELMATTAGGVAETVDRPENIAVAACPELARYVDTAERKQ